MLSHTTRLLIRSSISHRLTPRLRPSFTGIRHITSSLPTGLPATTAEKPRRKNILAITLSAFASLTAYTLGSIYPPTTALSPPPDPNSPESLAIASQTEKDLLSLPLLQQLREAPNAKHEWYETRPYSSLPPERRVNNLSAGALQGPGKLAVPPLVWARRDESEAYVFIHVGSGLCGHEGIVHGGLLATLIDEALGRQAITNLPARIGVTATLSLNYRAPTKADQFIVIKTKLDELKGRKARVSARVEDLNGTLLVDASAMFVQPRYAKLLNTSTIRQFMGEAPPVEEPVLLADGERLGNLRKK